MSASIRAPWIHEYLLRIAEEHGGDLITLAPEARARKGQLIQWLTYPRDDNEDVFLWAMISDKVHSVHVRFSKEAVRTIKQNSIFAGRNVTTHKTSMITIKQFRPFMTRVPLGPTKGMSVTDHIALDVEDFTLPGAFNEPAWGEPKPVELQPDIHEWVQGLRQAGGAGNVLKLRKAAREQGMLDAPAPPAGVHQDPVISGQQQKAPLTTIPRRVKLAARRSLPSKPVTPPTSPPGPVQPAAPVTLDPRQVYERKWKPFSANKRDFPVPDEIKARLRALPFTQLATMYGTEPDALATVHERDSAASTSAAAAGSSSPPRKRRRLDPSDLGENGPPSPISAASQHSEEPDEPAGPIPRTPSHWSPSSQGSPRADVAFLDDDDDDADDDDEHDDSEIPVDADADAPATSPPRSPSSRSHRSLPSQQDHEVPTSKFNKASPLLASKSSVNPEPTSSYLSAPTPAQRPRPVPSSSPLAPAQDVSVSAIYESPLYLPTSRAPPSSFHLSHQRRVPRPVCNRLSPDPNASGPGRILVPNSDTSASLSQDQPFSQQSQSQQVGSSQLMSQLATSSQPRSQQADSSQSQGKSEEQKEGRSQQSLSYASESQNSRSQGSKQSQLRNEIIMASEEAEETRPARQPVTVEESTAIPQAAGETKPSSPPRVFSPDTPDPHTGSSKVEAAKDQASSRDSRSQSSKPSRKVVVDSETEEDSDTGNEQDELESVAQGQSASRRAPALDSDDEVTNAMVDQYTSRHNADTTNAEPKERPQQDAASKADSAIGNPRKKDVTRRPLRKNGSTASHVNSEMPLPPSSPDVFSSEASFYASEGSSPPREFIRSNKALLAHTKARDPTTPVRNVRESGSARGRAVDTGSSDRTRVDKVPPPTHDPEAWKAPAFLRKPAPAKQDVIPQKPKTTPVKARIQPAKRVISVSSGSEDERPPKKKMKTTDAATARTSGWVQTTAQTLKPQQSNGTAIIQPPTTTRTTTTPGDRSAAAAAVVSKQLESQRDASVVSSNQSIARKQINAGRSTSPGKRASSGPEVKVIKRLSPGGSTPVEVRHVDFVSGSRRSSSTSVTKGKLKPRIPETSLPHSRHTPIVENHGRTRPAVNLPSTSTAIVAQTSAADKGPTNKNSSTKSTPTSGSTAHVPQTSVASSSTSGSARLSRVGAGQSTETPLLGGYEVNFNECSTEGGPPLVNWASLRQILLNTGRAKHKLKMQQQQGRG